MKLISMMIVSLMLSACVTSVKTEGVKVEGEGYKVEINDPAEDHDNFCPPGQSKKGHC